MANAAALAVGLALIWVAWAPQTLDPRWLIAGALSLCAAFAFAVLAFGLRSAGSFYARAPGALVRAPAALARMCAGALDLSKRALAADPMLFPGLMHLRTRTKGIGARLAFAQAVARAPGAVVIDAEDEALLVHVLGEPQASEAALRALEHQQ